MHLVPAAADAKLSMSALIVEYQRSRVVYYIDKLHQALTTDQNSRVCLPYSKATLTEESLINVPPLRSRTWSDDNGNTFELSLRSATTHGVKSEAAISGDSLSDIDAEITAMFDKVHRLCCLGLTTNTSACFTKSQISLLQEVTKLGFRLRRSV